METTTARITVWISVTDNGVYEVRIGGKVAWVDSNRERAKAWWDGACEALRLAGLLGVTGCAIGD